ncbi:copper resistance CopC/CopD family protein [Candidatus Solirubrobacter pratensis]|uniref:copper resistance CopC/CopD family protein n=1 Tax=Candidatus Solirubrobacter pratensis TaxID=1298857 RepID=UPI00041980D3|nr:copper resistance protein CopC [Candidatus Solirubrobacter pratensis]
MTSRIARWTLAALVAAAILPAAAAAHATIVASTPGDTAVVKAAPPQVTLKWSESVDLGAHAVRLLDGSGKELPTPAPRHGPGGPATAVLTLPRGLGNGTYVVAWRVVSADSHPVSGAVSFSIGAPSAVLFSAGGTSSAAVRGIDAVGRGAAFVGLAITIGGSLVLLVLWPEGPASRRARRLLWGGIGALLAGSVAVLLLQGPYASGGALSGAFSPSLISFSLSTRFGHALVIRILLALVFAGLVARALQRGGAREPAIAVPAAACGLGLIATWTLTDHSRTGVQTWLGVPVASAHLLAMALWFGGLVLLLGCVLGRPHATLAPVVPRFSRLALACFAVLGASGLYLSWRQVGALGALPSTDFGKLLLLKAGIVLAIVGLAALSRRALRRGGDDLARLLRRSVAGEAFLGVAVLGVTATLVNTAPARVSYVDPVDTTVAGPAGARLQVKLSPAKAGRNVLDVYLLQRDGSLMVVPELTARLLPPDAGTGPLNAGLAAAEPGHYVADDLSVPFAGRWTLRLQIRTSEIDEDDVDVPVRIR